MKIEHLMSPDVCACKASDSLSAAAMIMWNRDCGFVPVVDNPEGGLVGVITDRDICVAAATKHRLAESIPVGEVMTKRTITCLPTDDVRTAIDRMVEGQVRRLPIVDKDGRLKGVLSLNDLTLAAEKSDRRAGESVTYSDLVKAMKAVSAHRLPTVTAAA